MSLICKTASQFVMLLVGVKEQIPQALRVWLRYRSEKYFDEHRTPPKSARKLSKC